MKKIIVILLIMLSNNAFSQIIRLEAKAFISSVPTTTQYKYYKLPEIVSPLDIYNYELTFVNNQNQNFVLNCKSGRAGVVFLRDKEHPGTLMMSPTVGYHYTFVLEKVCVNDISCREDFYTEFCILQASNCSLVLPNPNITFTNLASYNSVPRHVEYNGELYLVKEIITNDIYNWDYMQGQGFDFSKP